MGRLLSDPERGTCIDDPRTNLIPFIDITDRYERSDAMASVMAKRLSRPPRVLLVSLDGRTRT